MLALHNKFAKVRKDHANLPCLVAILSADPRRESIVWPNMYLGKSDVCSNALRCQLNRANNMCLQTCAETSLGNRLCARTGIRCSKLYFIWAGHYRDNLLAWQTILGLSKKLGLSEKALGISEKKN